MVVFIVSMLNGLFMFLGLTFLFKSIKIADVAKAVPINNIGQFLSATLVSAFFFGNWLGDNAGVKILYGFIFIAIILVGIILISIYPGGKSEVLPAGMVEAITVQTKTKNTINSKFFLYEFISIGSLFMLFFTPELIANFNNETS
jgi:glucose uptake protein GlcU